MTKSQLQLLLERAMEDRRETRKSFRNGSKGKLGNSKKAVTPAQKHKGKR